MKTKKNSYWDKTGKFQKQFDKLTEELMPDSGDSDTLHGQLITACNRIAYDYYNNGFCNTYEQVDNYWLDSMNYADGDHFEPTQFYKDLINLIRTHVKDEKINDVMDFIEEAMGPETYELYEEEGKKLESNLNEMIDIVTENIIKKKIKNIPLPKKY